MSTPAGGKEGPLKPPDPGGDEKVFKPEVPASQHTNTPPPMNFKAAVSGSSAENDQTNDQELWIKKLAKIATRPWKAKCDDELRPMIPAEKEALAAWAMGAIHLEAPPSFLVCTHTLAQRVAFLSFFETHLEGTLVATIPPLVKMPEHLAEKTLLAQLVMSEKKGSAAYDQICKLIRETKRAEYNSATRRLTIVVPDRLQADAWHRRQVTYRGAKLLLLSMSKLEEEDMQLDVNNETPHDGAQLRYQVRVLTQRVPVEIVEQVMRMSSDCDVLSITRETARRSDAYDSNYFLIVFNSETCPQQLKMVTHISAGRHSIFIHHFQHQSRIPCFNCYDPAHPVSKCDRKPGSTLAEHHRRFSLGLQQPKTVTRLALQHMTVAERLASIQGAAAEATDYLGGLKKAAEKAEVLIKSAVADETTGQCATTDQDSVVGTSAPEPAAPQESAKPSEGWIDPADNRKGKQTQRNGKLQTGGKQSANAGTTSNDGRGNEQFGTEKREGKTAAKDPSAKQPNPAAQPHGNVGNPTHSKQQEQGVGKSRSKEKAIKRRQGEAALATAYEAASAPSPQVVQASDDGTTNADKRAVALKVAIEKADKLQHLARSASARFEQLASQAAAAKQEHQTAAADAHTQALVQDEARSQLTDAQRLASAKADKAARDAIVEALSLLLHLQNKAKDAAEEAKKEMSKANGKARKAIAKRDKLLKAMPPGEHASNAQEQRESTNTQPDDTEDESDGVEDGIAERNQLLQKLKAALEAHARVIAEGVAGRSEAAGQDVEHPLDATLRFNDLGAVTPPQQAGPVPFPSELQASFDNCEDVSNNADLSDEPEPDLDASMVGSRQTEPSAGGQQPTSVLEQQDQEARTRDAEVRQQQLRQQDDHAATLQETRRRKGQLAIKVSDAAAAAEAAETEDNQEPGDDAATAQGAGLMKQSLINNFYHTSSTPGNDREQPEGQEGTSEAKQATPHVDRLGGIGETGKPAELVDEDCVEVGTSKPTEPVFYLHSWIESHSASIIDVPGNGNCMYGAFFATTVGTYEDGPTLKYEGGKQDLVQIYKERILFICQDMVRTEACIGPSRLFLLRDRLTSLYPSEGWQDVGDLERVRDRLIRHYDKASDFLVTQRVGPTWWGRAAELVAASVYLREPIYVIDVLEGNEIRVHCYNYRDEMGPDGVAREVGVDWATTMSTFEKLVSECLSNAVIPTVLILRHDNGTQHYQAVRFSERLYRDLELEPDDVHPNMRERLEVIHRELGMPIGKSDNTYDFDSQSSGGIDIQQRARLQSPPKLPAEGGPEFALSSSQTPSARSAHTRGEEKVYARVLALGGKLAQGSLVDRRKHAEYTKANDTIIKQWRKTAATTGSSLSATSIATLRKADFRNDEIFGWIKRLFYLLPHPEITAQSLGIPVLLQWGERQATRAQSDYLIRVSLDTRASPKAKTFATEWHVAVSATTDHEIKWKLLNDSSKWLRLQHLGGPTLHGCAPAHQSREMWALLNIMPYLLYHWRPMSVETASPPERDAYREDVRLEDVLVLYNEGGMVHQSLREVQSTNDWRNTRSVGYYLSQRSTSDAALWPTQDSYEGSSVASRS